LACPEETAGQIKEQGCGCDAPTAVMTGHIRRLQIITLIWMLAECVIALAAAWRARSPVLLAFGVDSFVELLSAFVVLLQFVPRFTISENRASRLAGILLFTLAGVVTFTSGLALFREIRPETSWMGIGIAITALIVMPVLSRAKRNAGKATGNRALAADAAQSATCAYLAAITLAGLALNAVFHIRWIDPVAALVAVPIICMEGRKALQGEACACSG
jgi:divalent metal cation (Fe/Co/Zn/Cd) transporter